MAAVLPVVRARSSIDALNYAIEELGHSQAELAEPIAISHAISILHECDLYWIPPPWLRQFEATQERRGDCW
jgi:hypothetical protein